MRKTLRSKTTAVSIDQDAAILFSWISQPENLSKWHGTFCRSIRREADQWIIESPRGVMTMRFVRNDHAMLLDLITEPATGVELTTAIRILPNHEGAEVIATVIQPQSFSDGAFHEHVRWVENAVRSLRRLSVARPTPTPAAEPEPVADPQTELEGYPAPAEASDAEALWDDAPSSSPEVTDPAEPSTIMTEAPSQSDEQPVSETAPVIDEAALSSKRLFVGNLPFDWSDEQLRETFVAIGAVVKAEVARFRRNGRSRGFGFVEMATEEETRLAIEKLHGGLAGTRKMVVRVARPKEESRQAEPGQEAPPPTRKPSPRHQQSRNRPSAPASQRSRTPEARPAAGQRRFKSSRPTEEEAGIISTGGYEYFPRRSSVTPSSETTTPASETPVRSSRKPIEPSPYMDDTGDIENRGSRRPPSRHRRGPRQRPRS